MTESVPVRFDDLDVTGDHDLRGDVTVEPRSNGCCATPPQILDCAVVTGPDRAGGESVVAFVVRDDGADIDSALLRTRAAELRSRREVESWTS